MSATNQLSPGVGVKEHDLTTSLPAVSTSGGGFVGNFSWGPVNERTMVSDPTEFEATFHKPTDANHIDWFSAINFLAYSQNLETVRVVDEHARNASNAVAQRIFNAEHFRLVVSVDTPSAHFAAKYPGAIGDSLSLHAADASTFVGWPYADLFDTAPGTSANAEALGVVDDELHVVVVDRLGYFSGVPGSVLERYPYVSKAIDAKDANGGPSYYLEQLNRFSQYVWALKPVDELVVGVPAVGAGGGEFTAITVESGGYGYTQGQAVVVAGSNAEGNGFAATLDVKNGSIEGVVIADGGTGFTVAPTIVATGSGYGFNATTRVESGAIVEVIITSGGQGYGPGTTFSISGPGTGADITPEIKDGVVTGVTVVTPGTLYTQGSLTATGGTGFAASASFTPLVTTRAWGSNLVEAGGPSVFPRLRQPIAIDFDGGVDSKAVTAVERIAGYSMFTNAETSDVGLVFIGNGGGAAHNRNVAQWTIDHIGEGRKDALVFVSPNLEDIQGLTASQATQRVKAFRLALNRSSSYGIMDSGWKVQYDVYNNKYRVIPLNADVAGLCAQVDTTNDPWWSPAGYNRGRVKNIQSLVFSPDKTNRDQLYKDGINPVATFGVDGTLLFGDKTLQGKLSAFSFIGIRRLFIILRKTISAAAKYTLFDFNTPFTRSNFINMVDPRLRDVQGRSGMDSYFLQCDERNNTDEVIQRGEFIATIFIKPMYSIQWVSLNFVAIRREVSFEEVVGITF